MTQTPKPLTRAALTRRVAQQSVWCVVSRFDGEVVAAYPSRWRARNSLHHATGVTVVIRAELRVKGVRA